MSDITANIVVQPLNLTVQVEQPTITITPEPVNLTVFAGGFAQAGGNNGTVQYNNGGVLAGIPSVFWTGSKLSLGNTNNITISGGSPNYALRTDGAGNLSWGDTANANYANFAGNAVFANNAANANIANVAYSVSAANITGTIATANYAAFAGNVTIAAQSNITSLGNLTSLRVNGVSNLNAISNVKITGGTNGQYLQTDGTGNLSFATGGGSGNGVVGGSNTQVQFNDGGSFGGAAGFTFDKTSNLFSVPGNAIIVDNVTATTFIGSLNGAATTAGTVTTAAQPNITSVGTLTGLTIGNATANAVFGNGTITLNSGLITGNGAGLSQLAGANVTGTVANATFATSAGSATTATSATTAGTVTTAAQPNITSVGTLTSLAVTGNLSAGNVNAGNLLTANFVTGTLTTAAQPNITSLGNLTGVVVQGTTQIQQAIEKVTVSGSAATGTVNFDVLTQAIILNTANATANFALNYRGNSTVTLNNVMPVGTSLTATFINTNGNNGFYADAIRIDGVNVTPIWSGSVPVIGTSNGKDVYTFNIIKTASNTYTVFGSQLGFS